jgi:Zn-dependent protease with chaperone function
VGVDGEGTAAAQGPGIIVYGCPTCGWTGEFDSRFIAWCEACGYGADNAPAEPQKPRAVRRAARARARAERQCEALLGVADLRPTSATGVAVTAVATLVHLLTLALFVGGLLAVPLLPGQWYAWPIAVLGVATAVVVRPRLWRVLRGPKNLASCLTRADAPTLFALLDRCAAPLSAPVPDYVAVDGRYNAATSRFGLRRRTVLHLGAPRWTTLTGPQRVTLLGHELGHQVNRDTTHGIWAWSARGSLNVWLRLLNPRETGYERSSRRRLLYTGGGPTGFGALLAPVVMYTVFAPFYLAARGCSALLERLDLASGQRAEFLADELGARLGSSAAAVERIDSFSLGDSVRYFIGKQRAARFDGDLWAALREYLDSVPEHEKRRRVRVDEIRGTRADSTHPANYLRRRLVTGRPLLSGTVRVDEAEWAAIDAELRPRFDAVARELLGRRAQRPAPRDRVPEQAQASAAAQRPAGTGSSASS